jgi:transcriptional regulator with XRE-family HTH domain
MAELQRRPGPVDAHVGDRIRMRRRILGLTQQELADALGLTFQQIQKYERGANRVSASKLFALASELKAPVSYFFEGLAEPCEAGGEAAKAEEVGRAIQAFLSTAEGLELARRFPLIPMGRLRRQVLELVRALSDETETEPQAAD